MNRNNMATMAIVAAIAFGGGAGIGILGYTWTVGGSGEASEPISAPTLDPNAQPTLAPQQVDQLLTQRADSREQINELEATIEAYEAAEGTPEPAE